MVCILIVGLSGWVFIRQAIFGVANSLMLMRRVQRTAAVVVSVTFVLVILTLVMRQPGSWVYPHLLDLGTYSEPFRGLLIANPSMRVMDALGIFGLITYLWFFCEKKQFYGRDYIWVGMLIPLITVFNPLFVYWFLHIASWDPIWRFALIVPIALVAANLIILTIRQSKHKGEGLKLIFRSVMTVALLVSVTPVAIGEFNNRTSRLPSLMPVDRDAGSRLYEDLIEYFAAQDSEVRIITDYVTNYVLTSALTVRGRRDAKASWQLKRSDLDGDYKDKLLYYRADDSLVVINYKDGRYSWTGKTSKHWPEDILKVSASYPKGLKQFLDLRSSDFNKVWEQNEVTVYRVLRNPKDY